MVSKEWDQRHFEETPTMRGQASLEKKHWWRGHAAQLVEYLSARHEMIWGWGDGSAVMDGDWRQSSGSGCLASMFKSQVHIERDGN